MLKRIANWLQPENICDPDQLAQFILTETSRIAQKATTGYCRTKAGTNVDLLFREEVFIKALESSRWTAFGLVLADCCLVVEGFLRPEAAAHPDELAAWILATHDGILDAHPHPDRGAEGWSAEKQEMRARLGRSRMAEPIPAANLGFDTAQRIYDSLPVHPKLRREDFELVQNLTRFGHISFREDLTRRVDPAAMVAAIIAAAPPPQ